MAKTNHIELTEVLTQALAERPDLQKRFSEALGAGPEKLATPGRMKLKARKNMIRQRFNRLHMKEKLKHCA
jgi:hypothetical protein